MMKFRLRAMLAVLLLMATIVYFVPLHVALAANFIVNAANVLTELTPEIDGTAPTSAFVLGPATPPAGGGSFQVAITVASSKIAFRRAGYHAIDFDNFNSITYSTYMDPTSTNQRQWYVNIYLDTNNNGTRDCRLDFVPPGPFLGWQTWTINDSTLVRVTAAGTAPLCTAVAFPGITIATVKATYPNAVFRSFSPTDFQIRFNIGDTDGTYVGYVGAIDNITIDVTGVGSDNFDLEPDPEIEVEQSAPVVALADGGTYTFPTTTTQGIPLVQSITVRNIGGSGLTLTDPKTVTGDFAAGNFGATTLAFNATTTFSLTCNATTQGAPNTGTVSFANNDGDENPFNFNVECAVGAPPPPPSGGGTGGGEGGGGGQSVSAPSPVVDCVDGVYLREQINAAGLTSRCVARVDSGRPALPAGINFLSLGYQFEGLLNGGAVTERGRGALACFETSSFETPLQIAQFFNGTWATLLAVTQRGQVCADFNGVGLLALLTGDSLANFAPPEALFVEIPLSNCTVTTRAILNLRAGPGLNFGVLRLVPYGENGQVLAALATFNNFYRVNFEGNSGWLSGSFLNFRGECGR